MVGTAQVRLCPPYDSAEYFSVVVMAGLVPAIHVLQTGDKKDVDARDKPGHDESEQRPLPVIV
jgi:hypothetical protein